MSWAELYEKDKQPTKEDIEKYIKNPLWKEINEFLKNGYDVEPAYSYSTCSGQPGWNVKYKKAGRALCTLYPMDGFFIALVVIGAKEEMEAELVLTNCTEYVQKLYKDSAAISGGHWMMIEVTDKNILEDVKNLIQTRRSINKKR